MKNILKRLYWDILSKYGREAFVTYLMRDIPAGFGIMLRRSFYNKRFKKAGNNLNVLAGTHIINPQNVQCGDNMSFGICNYIQAGGGLEVGDDVMFGPYVKVWTQTHNFESKDIPMREQGYSFDPVTIGDDVWIGANAFLMPGVEIGSHSIISACSVVGAKKYPDGIILAGNPARKIGER